MSISLKRGIKIASFPGSSVHVFLCAKKGELRSLEKRLAVKCTGVSMCNIAVLLKVFLSAYKALLVIKV